MIGKYNLWLDDNREPDDSWVWAKDYDHFVSILNLVGNPKDMSLDHDLGPSHNHKTGMDCLKYYLQWLEDTERLICGSIRIHSMNAVGAENMRHLIASYCKYNSQSCSIRVDPFGDFPSGVPTESLREEWEFVRNQ